MSESTASRHTGTTLILLVGAATLGCEDRITGPEAAEIVTALERGLRDDSLLRQIYLSYAMGGWSDVLGPVRHNAAATTTVALRRDGEPVEYRAIVYERVVIPPPGLDSADACQFALRRSLLLWRFGDPTEGLVFTGRNFRRPIGRWAVPCTPEDDGAPALGMDRLPPWAVSHATRGDIAAWGAVDGDGEISSAEDLGDCGFSREDARFLLEEVGATCQRTMHRVRFRAQLDLVAAGFLSLDSAVERFTLELPLTLVVGFRYTVHCDQRPDLVHCRPW